MHNDQTLIARLAHAGIILPDTVSNITQSTNEYAMDAANFNPTLVGSVNSGIPSFLTTYVDPKVIEVNVAPMNAARLVGETKKGDWTTLVAAFIQVEPTTKVATYGDFSADGSSDANINYPQRQSYFFQTWTRWGERQLAMAGAGRVDWASQLNYSSALGLAKFLNQSYLYGIAGLQNYGLTNDPQLIAPITAPNSWATGTPDQIFNSLVAQFKALALQSNGVIKQTDELRVGLDPSALADANNVNSYGLSAMKLIKDAFPRMEFVEIPEFNTAAGRLVQMWAIKIEGEETATCAFTEKMRAHAVERYSSYFRQKKSAGTWGAVVFKPFAMSAQLGV